MVLKQPHNVFWVHVAERFLQQEAQSKSVEISFEVEIFALLSRFPDQGSSKCCKEHVITVPASYNCHEVPQINDDTVFLRDGRKDNV